MIATPRITFDYLLIDNDKGFVAASTDAILEGDDLLDPFVGERPLCLDKLLSLCGALVEEPRVNFAANKTIRYFLSFFKHNYGNQLVCTRNENYAEVNNRK